MLKFKSVCDHRDVRKYSKMSCTAIRLTKASYERFVRNNNEDGDSVSVFFGTKTSYLKYGIEQIGGHGSSDAKHADSMKMEKDKIYVSEKQQLMSNENVEQMEQKLGKERTPNEEFKVTDFKREKEPLKLEFFYIIQYSVLLVCLPPFNRN